MSTSAFGDLPDLNYGVARYWDPTNPPNPLYPSPFQGGAQRGEGVRVQAVRKALQALQHPVHPPAHPQRHAALSLQLLRQAVPPEERHEEAHLHPHR